MCELRNGILGEMSIAGPKNSVALVELWVDTRKVLLTMSHIEIVVHLCKKLE